MREGRFTDATYPRSESLESDCNSGAKLRQGNRPQMWKPDAMEHEVLLIAHRRGLGLEVTLGSNRHVAIKVVCSLDYFILLCHITDCSDPKTVAGRIATYAMPLIGS